MDTTIIQIVAAIMAVIFTAGASWGGVMMASRGTTQRLADLMDAAEREHTHHLRLIEDVARRVDTVERKVDRHVERHLERV